jgi:ABC-2 type transport system ATP-binding protein
MNDVLVIEGASKSFGGQKVLERLNLSVPEGSVFGFIGKNGAGKTTTMKMVLGLLKADGGSIRVFGERVQYGQTKTNRHIGYLPDIPEFYDYMRPLEYLNLCGEIGGLSKAEIKNRGGKLLELVGLEGVKKRIGGFSRGMKGRLGIAQALLTRPRLLICDEPTSALDPAGRKEILEILQKIRGESTVIFSTHILADVERICDRLAVLHNGNIAIEGTLSEVKAAHGTNSLYVEFSRKQEINEFKACVEILPLLSRAEERGTGIIFRDANIERVQRNVFSALAETGLCPLKVEIMEPSLENLFLEAVE